MYGWVLTYPSFLLFTRSLFQFYSGSVGFMSQGHALICELVTASSYKVGCANLALSGDLKGQAGSLHGT